MNVIKNHKLKISIILFIIVIAILIYFSSMVSIPKFLKNKGFSVYDDTMYYLQKSELSKSEYEQNINKGNFSEYDYLYFGLGTNHLSEEIGTYYDGVNIEYAGEYNYKNNSVIYTLRGEYNSTLVHFTGEYNINGKEFTCESLLQHSIKNEQDINSNVCELAKNYSYNLYEAAINLVDDQNILNKIIKNSSEY